MKYNVNGRANARYPANSHEDNRILLTHYSTAHQIFPFGALRWDAQQSIRNECAVVIMSPSRRRHHVTHDDDDTLGLGLD